MSRLEQLTEAWSKLPDFARDEVRVEWLEKFRTDPAFAFTADVLLALQEENEKLKAENAALKQAIGIVTDSLNEAAADMRDEL